jgi:hypothetical protein
MTSLLILSIAVLSLMQTYSSAVSAATPLHSIQNDAVTFCRQLNPSYELHFFSGRSNHHDFLPHSLCTKTEVDSFKTCKYEKNISMLCPIVHDSKCNEMISYEPLFKKLSAIRWII